LTPAELVKAGIEAGLSALAVTDHDTIDGVAEAIEVGEQLGLRVLTGVEISAELAGGTLHVLGYGFDCHDPGINQDLNRLKQAREDRNPQIIQKLVELGIPITMEQVREQAGSDLIGRPHMAQALVDLGVVATVQQAFDEYLATGARAHVDKFRFDPETAFAMIRSAGGIPVMAHPYQTRHKGDDLRQLVADLVLLGLEGIEVYYTRHSPKQVDDYSRLVEEFDLVATGGTDFHGDSKPDVTLGRGAGSLFVPSSLLEAIDSRIQRVRAA
jgi:predicted metal-dependent phosphoesterase TrpH